MLAKLKEMYSYNKESGEFTRLTNSGGYEIGSVAGRSNNGYVSIGIDGKRINLGRFTKFLEAVDARMNAEILYGVTK